MRINNVEIIFRENDVMIKDVSHNEDIIIVVDYETWEIMKWIKTK